MEKRDYLMDQIEQLGQALALIFSKLYGLRSQGRVPEGIELTNQSLKSELNLDIDELSSIPTEQFVNRLKEEKRFNHDNLERLADILLLIADNTYSSNPDSDQGQNLYSKCLEIYNYVNDSDLTYSFERQSKIERIISVLS
jgi:hypothetical protein